MNSEENLKDQETLKEIKEGNSEQTAQETEEAPHYEKIDDKTHYEFHTPYRGQLEIIDTYKLMVEDAMKGIGEINTEMINIAKHTENSIKELDSAIKATQIYEKLFTKLAIGFSVVVLGLIVVLFIVK